MTRRFRRLQLLMERWSLKQHSVQVFDTKCMQTMKPKYFYKLLIQAAFMQKSIPQSQCLNIPLGPAQSPSIFAVSYTHLRAHETLSDL
eukprot:6613699-Karenia_brevis.AAC.1